MSILKKLAGETAVYGLSSIVGRFLNYLLVPLYTGIFKPGEYGVSTLFYAYASFLGVLFTYGMETAFFRFHQKHEPKEEVFSTAFGSLALSSVVLAVLVALFAHPLALWTDNVGRENLFIYLGFILAADALSALPFALLRQQGQAQKFASLRLLNIATNIGLNLFFYKIINCKSITYMFVANLVSSLIVLPFFWKEITLIKFGINKTLWKEMLMYAFPLIFMGFAGMINETIDRILLKKLIVNQTIAEYQIGVYGANYKLAILITLFIQAFRFAAEPFFFARMKADDAKVSYAKVMNYFVIICSVIFLSVLLYLDVLKYFIRNEAYWVGLKVVPILLFANICLGIYYNLSIWYKLTNKTTLGAYVALAGALITIVLNYLWIPKYGYMGSAWATLICYASMVVISYVQGKKHYPVPYQVGKISVYLGAAVLLYFISLYTTQPIANIYLKLGLNTLILAFYTLSIAFLERKSFEKMIEKKE
jgi:O-antigen/teichoic acid export membrane protein